MLAREKRAQDHGHNRIDIGIGRDLGRIAVPQKVNISGEANDGPIRTR